MTDREKLKRITKLVNNLALDDFNKMKFDEIFPKQTINDIKEALWEMYCFVDDVIDTIDMDDTEEKESEAGLLDKIRAEIDGARYFDKDTKLCKNANASGLKVAMQIIDKYRKEN